MMKTLSSLGIGLSLVFGCLLLALVVELYYFLWWKKRIASREIEDDLSSSARELLYLFCRKKSSSLSPTALDTQTPDACRRDSDGQLLKSFGEDGLETEIVTLQNLPGPPRFLFTIKEETKEDLDLEADDGKSESGDDKCRKGPTARSLTELLSAAETPYLTPLSSPPFFTPPLTPFISYNQHGFNPLFESSIDAEVNLMRSSPPPTFKFLKDAEEKLSRKTSGERAMKIHTNGAVVEDGCSTSMISDEEEGSFLIFIKGKNKEKLQHQLHSSSSQVLPLPSYPSTIRPANSSKN